MPMLQANGINIHYTEAGQGPTLLLVHNVIADVNTFCYNIPDLSRYYRVVACDLRGHGKTSKVASPEDAPTFYNFDLIVEDLSQVLSHLGVNDFYVLGQAYWGVSIALSMFLRHQAKVKGIVTASCNLISSKADENPHDSLGEEARSNFLRMQHIARTQGMSALFEERKLIKTFWSPRLLANQDILSRFSEMYAQTCPHAFCNFPKVSPERHAEITQALRSTGVPLLMLMGAEDSHNESMIAATRKDYEKSQIVLVPDAGHYPAIEAPRDFNNAVLNFLAGVRTYGALA